MFLTCKDEDISRAIDKIWLMAKLLAHDEDRRDLVWEELYNILDCVRTLEERIEELEAKEKKVANFERAYGVTDIKP